LLDLFPGETISTVHADLRGRDDLVGCIGARSSLLQFEILKLFVINL